MIVTRDTEIAAEVRRVIGDSVLLAAARNSEFTTLEDVCDSIRARAPVDFPRRSILLALLQVWAREARRQEFTRRV